MKPSTRTLGLELRGGTDDFVRHRRAAATLAFMSMGPLAVVALYPLGAIQHLPEPPVPGLDAEKVNGSAAAYRLLDASDAVLGTGSYAATLGLVATDGANHAETQPLLPLALAVKAGLDTFQAARTMRKSWIDFHASSFYSLVTVAATFLALPTVFPKAAAAWREVTDDLGIHRWFRFPALSNQSFCVAARSCSGIH